MLEGFVEQYLLRYLGDYIFGVDKQNLSVTTWRGEIHLRSARLKQEVVELLNLPFKLIFSEAADLKINVPWNRLGSRPVVVELTGLRVLLGPKPATEWSNEEELRRVQLARQRLVDRADLLFGLEASPDDRKEGYLGRLVTRISDNLELQLRDLHIRFQDDSPAAGGPPVSGGLHLASLEVQSTGSDWQPSFIERSERSELFKLLQLRNLSCYHEPPGWAARSEGTDAIRRCFLDWPKEIQLKQGRIVYLLPPCSGQLKLTQALDVSEKSEEPRFDLQCELEPIKVLVSSASYRGVCGIMSLVSEYFAFQEVTRHWIQSYWPYRPVVHVHGNSLLWWRYAFRCIRAAKANVRAPAKASRFIQLLTEENLSRLRLQAEYCTLVVKSRSVQLPEHEQARLQRLRVSLPATELLRCHAMALERLQAQGEASADPGRWSFWGRTKVLSVPSSPSLAALEAPAVEDEILEGQSGHSGPCEVHRDVEREDLAFKYRPSVGSWLMPRPCRIPWPDAEAEGQGFEEGFEELDMLDMAEGAQDHEVDEVAEVAEVAEVEGESSNRASIALCEAKETEAFPQDDFRFMPSVGTWLQPRYEEHPPPEMRKRPEPEPEKSWLAWLLPSRFGEREVSQRDTSQRQSAQAESSSWLSWRRKPRPEPPPSAAAVPAVPAAAEKAQSSWFPSFRWFSEQQPAEEKEASVQEESSSGETPKPTSPVQAVLSTSPSNNPPAWRVWFSPASGTDPPAAAQPSPHPVEGQQPRPVAFTKVVAPIDEVPLLRLALELPEVNVEIQTQKHVKTIGFAKSLRLKLLAGDELNTKAEVADLQLLVRCSRHKTPVDTYLLHSGHLEKVMSVEYISRDSEGQPLISIKAQNLVLFYQQELFQQVTNFLAADFTVGKPRRGFDRWRRRAKALLYTRGRPRCQLQLGDPTLLVPTRPWPARAPRAGGGPVLALSARFVDAVSREVSDVEDEVRDFQLVRVDRWHVDCNGLQLLHFPSYRAFMTSRPLDWMLLQDTNIKLTCLAKRYEELLPPALLAFGVRQTPQALTSTEVEGEMQSLALNFNSVAYDSFIRAFRLLLRGPAGSSPPVVVPPVNQVREPLREETFSVPLLAQETRPQSVYSFSSDEEGEVAPSTSNASGGSTVPSMKRTRFLSAESGLFMHLQSPTAEEPPTPFCALPDEGKEPEGHKTMSIATKIGVVSLRFHCLSDATVELKASKAVVAFDLFQGYARIGLDMAELEMCSGTRCLVRADSESKAKVSLSLVAAWTAEAKLREAEAADLRISLDLRNGSFFFSPMYFREFISFAKTTPPGDVLKLPGDPLLWRIRVSLDKGLLHWVDEATNKLFAESKMKQSKILLDLHQDTVSFSSFFEDFSIQDCSSARRPMILAAQPGETYHMEIAARTFLSNSPEFRGYHTQVSISFRAVHLQYMGQKFMKCWQWVFGSFLPALTAGRRKGTVAAESSEEETSSSASFVSAEDGETREVPQESGEKFLAAAKAASTTELFVELAEGDFAAGPAWEAAEKAVRQAESSQVPTLTRLHVSIDNVMVSIPLETGGQDKEPVVEIRARCIKASNGPCRRQGRIGLVDALALNFEQVSILEAGGVRMVAPQDMSVQIDLNLQVRDPPLPMHVLWRAPAHWELSSRSLALLRAAFSKNVAGIDLDLPQTTPTPEQLSKPKEFPVWLVFRLLFHNFKLRMQESEKTVAELGAKQLIVEVKKHAAPRAVISFQVWEARLSSGLLPAPFNQLLCKRPSPKASALGRKGPSVYGAYTSDHSTGQEFQIHCSRPRMLLLLPLLRRCWAWMFPPKPWFSPPIILGERPSSQTEVRAALQDAHVLLVDKFEEKEGPLISVLTDMQYQLESSPEMQKWCISFDNPEVFYTHGWPGVVDMEVKDSLKHRSLAKAKDMAFDVVTKTQSEGNTLGRRLSCQELRGNLSNCDLHLWIACVKRAWGITKELPEEPKDQSNDSNGPENAKTALELDFRDVNVTLLSEHDCANPGSCPRFLKLRSSELFFSQSERLAEGVERRIRAKLSLWLFNHIASDWEPLLEGQPLDASEPRQYTIKAVCNSLSDATEEGPSTSISIESADRLLVNVSELCWHVLPALSAPWLAPDGVMPPPLLSPYAVRNDLGMPIALHLPHTKNGRARRVRLEPSSEQRLEAPHWTEESKESKESKGFRTRNLATVELEGPRAVEVEGISLDCVGRRVYPLPAGMTRSSRSSSEQVLPGQAHQAVVAASRKGLTRATSHPELRRVEDAKGTRFLPTPYLVCRVQAKEAYKKIVLEPPARIINQMNVSVELKLSVNGKEILRTEVPPEGTAVPLDLRGAFVARPTMWRGVQWSREFLFEWLGSTQQAGDFRCASPGDKDAEGSFTFCIEWQTEFIPHHDLCAPQYTIRLCAPVTLVSALPVACKCEVRQVKSTGEIAWRQIRDLAALEKCEIHFVPVSLKLELRLAIFGDLWSDPLELKQQMDKVSIPVPVDGIAEHNTHFQAIVSWSALGKPLTVVVHSPTWIADHVCAEHLGFAFQGKQGPAKDVFPVKGTQGTEGTEGKPRMLPLDCRATHVGFKLFGQYCMSEAVSLAALSVTQMPLKAKRKEAHAHEEMLLGLHFTERMEAGLGIRVLHVVPGQVAVNATGRKISLRPASRSRADTSTEHILELAPGDRIPVHWGNGQELFLQASISTEANGVEKHLNGQSCHSYPRSHWSGRLPVGSVGEYSFQYASSSLENFRVEVRSVDATKYFVFREAGNSTPILLKNLSSEPLLFQQDLPPSWSMEASEDNSDRQRWFSKSFTSSSHSTPEMVHHRDRGLKLEPGQSMPFAWAEPAPEPPHQRKLEVRSCRAPLVARLVLEKTERSLPLPIASQPKLFYDVVTSGPSLVMTVRNEPRPEVAVRTSGGELHELQVKVNLAGLGFSLVAPTSCAFPEAQDDGDVLRREMLYCSVDKVLGSFRRYDDIETAELTLQEVQVDNQRDDAMHPVLLKRLRKGKDDAAPLLRLEFSRFCDPQRPQLLNFDRLELGLRSIDLRLDQGFIFDMMALVRDIRTSLGLAAAPDSDLGLEKEGLKIHFKHLKLDGAKVGVSFSSRISGSAPRDEAFWKRLLSSISSVDRAVIRFQEYTLQETTADAANFMTTLQGHYSKQFMKELMWFVGRLEVLGMPSSLCGSICWNCKEGVLCAPYKATSPEDFLEKCLVGIFDCGRNSFFECCNSTSKATGAASQGCRLCLPQDFRQPPGGPKTCSCFGSVQLGIRGLWSQPVKGYRSAGLRGCAKGTTQGVVGCLGGITLGCLDVTRETSASLRDAASRTDSDARLRPPRPLYGVARAMQPFDQRDAELKAQLVLLDPSLASMSLLECKRDDAGDLIAAATDAHFLYLCNGKLTKVRWEDIVEVEVSEKAICIQRATGKLCLEDDEQRCRIAAQLLGTCLGADQ